MPDIVRQVEERLPDGFAGTVRTLDWMAGLVRRDSRDTGLRDFALSLVDHCGGHQFRCEVEALFRFVRDEITFRKDPVGQERVQDARRTLQFASGDCDDKCVLLGSLLGTIGHRSRFVIIGHRPDRFSHVFIEVQLGSKWLSLDPTPERAEPGWEAKGMGRRVYQIWPAGQMLGADPPIFEPIDPKLVEEAGRIATRRYAEQFGPTKLELPIPAPPKNDFDPTWLLVGAAGLLGMVLIFKR